MDRASAIERLRVLEPRLRAEGLAALYLFGSVARDEARATSDLDLLFDVNSSHPFSVWDQARIQLDLSDLLAIKIDLVAREGLFPSVRSHAEATMVRIF